MLMIFTMKGWSVLNPIYCRKKKERMTERAFPECRRYILSQNSAFLLISQKRCCNRCLEMFSNYFFLVQENRKQFSSKSWVVLQHISGIVVYACECVSVLVFVYHSLSKKSPHKWTLNNHTLVPNWRGMPQWATDFTSTQTQAEQHFPVQERLPIFTRVFERSWSHLVFSFPCQRRKL